MRRVKYLVLVAALGVIAWLAQFLYWPDAQARARQAIDAHGGIVLFDSTPGQPPKLVLLQAGISDQDLEDHKLELLQPRVLRISPYSQVTDRGLEGLGRLQGLESLILVKAAISDNGLAHLAAFPHLRSVVLDSCAITDNGLKHLKALPELREASLQDTLVTQAGIQQLRVACPLLHVVGSNNRLRDEQ
jgi:hypothetical protein